MPSSCGITPGGEVQGDTAFLPELQDAVQSPSAVVARIEIVLDGIEKAVENVETMTTSIQHIFDLVSFWYNQTEFDAITKSLFGAPLSGSQPPDGIHQDAEIDDLKRCGSTRTSTSSRVSTSRRYSGSNRR